MIEDAGCELLFLPPYSPDFNPVEHVWHQIKSAFKAARHKAEDLYEMLKETVEMRYKKFDN